MENTTNNIKNVTNVVHDNYSIHESQLNSNSLPLPTPEKFEERSDADIDDDDETVANSDDEETNTDDFTPHGNEKLRRLQKQQQHQNNIIEKQKLVDQNRPILVSHKRTKEIADSEATVGNIDDNNHRSNRRLRVDEDLDILNRGVPTGKSSIQSEASGKLFFLIIFN